MPNSGIRKKAVANVPAMLPAVEIANRRPATRPRLATELATRRIAIGVTAAMTMLGKPKSAIAATSGFKRGPGFQPTTASSTCSSTTGIASTSNAAIPITVNSSLAAGNRSATTPPAQ